MIVKFNRATILICLLITGCAGAPMRSESTRTVPVPIDEPLAESETAGPKEESVAKIRAYEPPAKVQARPAHSSAVGTLLATAQQQEARGDTDAAVITIERALRIEPRNAHLWNRLAHLRLTQKRLGQAADIALKSNALAGSDNELKRANWYLIARARREAGDVAGARVAKRKAQMLQ